MFDLFTVQVCRRGPTSDGCTECSGIREKPGLPENREATSNPLLGVVEILSFLLA